MSDNFRSFPTSALIFGKFCYKIQIVNLDAKSGSHVKCDILKAHSVYLPIHEDERMKNRYNQYILMSRNVTYFKYTNKMNQAIRRNKAIKIRLQEDIRNVNFLVKLFLSGT